MSVVKVNRELLTDSVDSLMAYHQDCWCSTTGRPCVIALRIKRLLGVLQRSVVTEEEVHQGGVVPQDAQ